ncbi:hypothetical protein B7R87_15585 [Streptomyces tsukubensis]|uniref:Uncharacterized protein n=1 Tax=Streptomyces tsukubensis (strain DSM 42081 / NBRC 108919 / NRRL 18488 / 9993) TaxID=1114943 RepID=I2N1S6_STRT9|nr:hypothetical protein B7R87_15585 [Streptomyces tsukubensis]EIF90973.1 hypothetical protein [Streptomyces tsukubensis NRRL18488]QKM68819.1 hypothetical protein STSU_018190 [Streptomyces tsukubensis NRRL18488]TAI43622.1 hypothetical protein EWI31_17940 [Streptomyces tsukubensis]
MKRPGDVPVPDADVRPRMTIRVSRDSGRTWGPVTIVRSSRTEDLPLEPLRFPPCRCPRCRAA